MEELGLFSENDTPCIPATPYGVAKLGFAQIIDNFARRFKYSYAWGRIFFTFGPYEDRQRLVPSVILSLLEGSKAELTEGKQVRDYIYVKDVAKAFIALLESPIVGPVNIASGHGISVSELANKIGNLLGKQELLKMGARKMSVREPNELVGNISRLNRELGFKPLYSLEQSLVDTVNWWNNETLSKRGIN